MQWGQLEAMLELAASPFLGVSVCTIFLVLSAALLPADCLKKPQGRGQVFFDVHSITPRCVSNAVSQSIPFLTLRRELQEITVYCREL